VAEPPGSPIELNKRSLESLLGIAKFENDLFWQRKIAVMAVKTGITALLPQLLVWARQPMLAGEGETISHNMYGPIHERCLSGVLRAIGFLARRLLDSDQPAAAGEAVALLHAYGATLAEEEDHSIVMGCTTALGYLGEWEPILTHLGPGEAWMHEAARNVFRHWVSKDRSERERAARWIARRLERHDLAPEVRSTLGELQERLEREIGYHMTAEADDAN
jgi:hypothetical protein